ncbi:hypothetical protein [Paenibacillus sp. Z6-24]
MERLWYTSREDGIGMTEPYFMMLTWCKLAGEHRQRIWSRAERFGRVDSYVRQPAGSSSVPSGIYFSG